MSRDVVGVGIMILSAVVVALAMPIMLVGSFIIWAICAVEPKLAHKSR